MKSHFVRNINLISGSLLLNLLLIGNANALSAKDIISNGNARGAIACASCHGEQGQGNAQANYPSLAGQPAAYLLKQLNDFAEKKRSNLVMQNFASALSENEKKAVSEYYARLSPVIDAEVVRSQAVDDRSDLLTARKIYYQGKWQNSVPACVQCHGDNGQGVAPHFPAIAGQHAGYLETQLKHWKAKERNNDPMGLMTAVVDALTEVEIKALAEYVSSLPAKRLQ